jgi:glutamate dehydrogenase (NAD(P)+)
VDLVRSGLEETMINSYHQIMDVYHNYEKVDNLRDAAFICALNKVASDYMTLGVFP